MRKDGRTGGQTDSTKLIVAFCSFVNAPKVTYFRDKDQFVWYDGDAVYFDIATETEVPIFESLWTAYVLMDVYCKSSWKLSLGVHH